jgi:hypothetical protein
MKLREVYLEIHQIRVKIIIPYLLIMLVFCSSASSEQKTAVLGTGSLEWDEMPQYLYTYDYNLSEVNITYETCANTFRGRLTGRNLKPNFTYQMKIFGKPCCYYSQGCDNESNEKIGYSGRWWDLNKSGANKNINDNEYEANKEIHCIFGYLVFDYFTTDANGDIAKDFECDSSYHVLWCNCTGKINNQDLVDGLCPECVTGEPEGGRPAPGTLIMPRGDYSVRFTLTEECFHQGWNWSSVLSNNSIEFTIERPSICGDVNDDGTVNMADVMTLWYDYADYPTPGAHEISNVWAADVNCDGVINMADVMTLWYDYADYPTPGAHEVNCCG